MILENYDIESVVDFLGRFSMELKKKGLTSVFIVADDDLRIISPNEDDAKELLQALTDLLPYMK